MVSVSAPGGFGGAFRGRRVLVTGHTGFKGSWLCEWLLQLGAEVTGYALAPATTPALFEQLGLARRLRHIVGNVRELDEVKRAVSEAQPDFVFHLAAQPLVRASYAEPVETFATNVLGTTHVLEAIRQRGAPCAVVAITSDKCYENKESGQSYREEDPLGGHDPYSASKASAELVVGAYRSSYFKSADSPVRLASARAGNVIGGGDWALDRIVPDCMRALQAGRSIAVRNPAATRPWQHVLEPVSGYLWLAARLAGATSAAVNDVATAFNFGPPASPRATVGDVVEEVLKHWPGRWENGSGTAAAMHEAKLLSLSTEKAKRVLGWEPVWDFAATIRETVRWYRGVSESAATASELTRLQIAAYATAARTRDLPWSQ